MSYPDATDENIATILKHYHGFAVWQVGTSETIPRDRYMGYLSSPITNTEPDRCQPDYSTNLWNYQTSPEEVIRLLAEKARNNDLPNR